MLRATPQQPDLLGREKELLAVEAKCQSTDCKASVLSATTIFLYDIDSSKILARLRELRRF
jgi:hypothetical protein